MAGRIQFMHELNSRILLHSSFSHILFLPVLPHPNIICKAFRAFHPMCFHCVPLDEAEVPDSHLFSVLKGQEHPCSVSIMQRSLELQNRFQKTLRKIHTAQGADKRQQYSKERSQNTDTAWTVKVTLFAINQHLLKI